MIRRPLLLLAGLTWGFTIGWWSRGHEDADAIRRAETTAYHLVDGTEYACTRIRTGDRQHQRKARLEQAASGGNFFEIWTPWPEVQSRLAGSSRFIAALPSIKAGKKLGKVSSWKRQCRPGPADDVLSVTALA